MTEFEAPDYVGELELALQQLSVEEPLEAVRTIESVLARHKDLPVAVHVLGLVAYRMDEPGRARELLESAHRLDPECLETVDALAILYARIGQLSECVYYGKLATALEPHPYVQGLLPDWYGTFEEAFLSISESRFGKSGDQMLRAGDVGGAVEMFRKESEAHPNDPDHLRRYASVLLSDDRPYDALIPYQQLSRISALEPRDELSIATCLSMIGRSEDAARITDGLVSEGVIDVETASIIVGDMARDPEVSVEKLVAAEVGWAEAFKPKAGQADGHGAIDKGVLKVGFVTGRAHTRGQLEFFWPMMNSLSSRRIAVHVYALRSVEDPIGRRLRGTVASWVDATGIDDATLCRIIRNDGIHVLVDLDGHSGSGRPGLFLNRPAPVAVRLMGIPASASAQGFDGVLGDSWIYPDDDDTGVYRVDGGLFRLPGAGIDMANDDADDELAGVFSSFAPTVGVTANRRDMTDAAWDVLKRVVDEVEGVRLLFSSRRIGGLHGVADLASTADELGIGDALDIDEEASIVTARAFVDQVDILLHIGSSDWSSALAEAVNAGTPVVALVNDLPSSRLCCSVLGTLGQSDRIVSTTEAAADAVVQLCNDPSERQAAGAEMRSAATEEGYNEAVYNWAAAFHSTILSAYERNKSA